MLDDGTLGEHNFFKGEKNRNIDIIGIFFDISISGVFNCATAYRLSFHAIPYFIL